jgi:hypothetical protein
MTKKDQLRMAAVEAKKRKQYARKKAVRSRRDDPPLTASVPETGRKYFGLSRNGSYDAAKRGDIPTIRVGKLLRVPIRVMERMLDGAGEQTK